MHTRRIGVLDASAVGLGCNNFGWRIDEAASARVVAAALDAGVTFFDTADIYGGGLSEEFLGRALGARRHDVVVATKFGHRSGHPARGGHPDHVRAAAEASLRRLGTDRIDLYQLHTPDPRVPVADTLGALDELVRAGKVREVGCSNFSAAQLREAERAAPPGDARFVSVQNEYSLAERAPERDGVLAECARQRLALLPYYPLASGLLSGKYRRGEPPPGGTRITAGRYGELLTDANLALVGRLAAWAGERGRTLLDLAFAWLLGEPAVASVIAGATSPEQVRANAAAASWTLTADERAAVDAIAAEGTAADGAPAGEMLA